MVHKYIVWVVNWFWYISPCHQPRGSGAYWLLPTVDLIARNAFWVLQVAVRVSSAPRQFFMSPMKIGMSSQADFRYCLDTNIVVLWKSKHLLFQAWQPHLLPKASGLWIISTFSLIARTFCCGLLENALSWSRHEWDNQDGGQHMLTLSELAEFYAKDPSFKTVPLNM